MARTYTRGTSSTPYTKESVAQSKPSATISTTTPSTKATVTNTGSSNTNYGQNYATGGTSYNPIEVARQIDSYAKANNITNASIGATTNNGITNFTVTPSYGSGSNSSSNSSSSKEMQGYDATQDIEALRNAQLESQLAGLQSRLDQAKAGIEEKRALLPAEIAEQKRQASVQNMLGRKSFSEFLAQRGLARSGEAGQANLMQNMALQGQLGAIGRQEQQQLGQMSRDELALQQDYLNNVGSTTANINSQMYQDLINEKLRQDQIKRAEQLRQEELARQSQQDAYTRALDLQNNQYDMQQDAYNRAIETAKLTGYFNPYYDRPLTQEEMSIVQPYYNDLSAQLQVEKDPVIRDILERAKAQKIFSSPEMLAQYGQQYMTPDAMSNIVQTEGKYLDNEAKKIANKYAPYLSEAELESVYTNIALKNSDKAMNDIKSMYLPAQIEQEMLNDIRRLDISQQQANISASKENRLSNEQKDESWFKDPNKAISYFRDNFSTKNIDLLGKEYSEMTTNDKVNAGRELYRLYQQGLISREIADATANALGLEEAIQEASFIGPMQYEGTY